MFALYTMFEVSVLFSFDEVPDEYATQSVNYPIELNDKLIYMHV